MFIHLGDDVIVNTKDIVAILDRQILTSSTIANDFLMNQNNKVIELSHGETKSIIITVNGIYFSPFASHTLKKRALPISDFDPTKF